MASIIDELNDEQFAEIINSSTSWKEMEPKFGYKNSISSNLKDKIRKRCDLLGLTLNIKALNKTSVKDRTKKELFETRSNWQCARSAITKNANEVYFKINENPKCAICGYDKHVEVAHIKSVSSFTDESLISEINSIDNLIGLCPNHHWEYDKGILDLKEKIKIFSLFL